MPPIGPSCWRWQQVLKFSLLAPAYSPILMNHQDRPMR
jgi:hypothetical protein